MPKEREDAGEQTADDAEEALDQPGADEADEAARREAVRAAFAAMTPTQFAALLKRLTLTAFVLTHDRARAPDDAHEAVTRILEHRRKWDPRKGELEKFAKGVVWSIVTHRFESAATKREIAIDDVDAKQGRVRDAAGFRDEGAPDSDREGDFVRPTANAEAAQVAGDERDASRERFAEVMREIDGDEDAMAVVRVVQRGVRKADLQAEELGMPIARVYAARKRIAHALEAVNARHPEPHRWRKRASRGVHAKREGAAPEEGEE